MLSNRLILTIRRKYSNIISSSIQIKSPKIPIDQYVMENWNRWEDRIAIECGLSGKRLSYKELRHRSKSLGVGLAQLEFKKKTALLAMPNCPEFPLALLGALQAGMTVSSADPLTTSKELKYQIADAGVDCVLTTPEYLCSIQRAVAGLDIAVMCTGPNAMEGVISFEQLSNIRDPYEELLPTTEEKMDQLALLPYTSGTTGLPKGVRLRHCNITANIEQISHHKFNILSETTDSHQDVVPAVLPLSHIYGITVLILRSLKMGAKILSLPKFHPEELLRLLISNKDIVLQGVPTIVNFLANDERVTPQLLERVRVIISSAAPSDPYDLEKLARKSRCAVLQAYGMTETSSLLTSPTTDCTNSITIGPLLPGTFCKVVDPETGKELPPGERGELCFKGPQVMEGYQNNPKATVETLDSEGWLHTGDIGYSDEEGNFFIVGRMKELIKVKGYQIAPEDIEALLRVHPKIAEAVVTSEICPRSGVVPVAFLVPLAGAELDQEEVEYWLGSNVVEYKRPARILVVDEVPKSAYGKILRRQLKKIVTPNVNKIGSLL
ncbi:uncharacterized protein [Halyomorpha halys]|uniref:uncharacterized protein n=1 Tax=Halyomorpha halys TaxID=286706 RepID=UPI0006D520EA|nr:4-coumarate--CoA ligase 1-like [Halyomorpha halys]